MRRSATLIAIATVLGAAMVGAAACSDDEDDGTATGTPAAPAAGTAAALGPVYDRAVSMALDQEIGSSASSEHIASVDIDIEPDGDGLPPGGAFPSDGATVYAEQCASCHGANGEGGAGPQLVTDSPGPWQPGQTKTIGNYWPYATTLYDFINRAMPFTAPGSLTSDQVYAVVAFLLAENGVIEDGAEMNAETLPAVEMPNRDNFVPCWPTECRPDTGG